MLGAESRRLKLLFSSTPTQKGTRFGALARTRLHIPTQKGTRFRALTRTRLRIPTQKGTRFGALTRTQLRSSCHVTVGR